ncbi:MAG: glycosyltransferase [Bacteroidia bacterium]|nr:glycosyltransferase [Methylotenera sp.]
MVDTISSSDKKPTYSIVLVNYKTLAITTICLNLLRNALNGADVPVWVVDNNSADESTDYLRTVEWIHLIERKNLAPEQGHLAHGRALDLVLEQVTTDYLFLLHTDTFIYDAQVFNMMLAKCVKDKKVVAVGCLEQMDRGTLRTFWRFSSRFLKHYIRRFKLALGLQSREPKTYREVYLKSFCALWNVNLIKQHNMHFLMNERIPGYELQDKMLALDYKIECISPPKLFRYLDHIQSGTVAAAGGYHQNHRRTKMYNDILEKISKN